MPTTHQVADVFTKGLSRSRFKFMCDKLHMWKSHIVPDSCSVLDREMSKRKSDLRGNVEEHVTCFSLLYLFSCCLVSCCI